jgi:hypothetical protein
MNSYLAKEPIVHFLLYLNWLGAEMLRITKLCLERLCVCLSACIYMSFVMVVKSKTLNIGLDPLI